MYNPKYRHIETGDIVTALDYKKDTYMDMRDEWIRDGEMGADEKIPTDEEFIVYGIEELEADDDFERI